MNTEIAPSAVLPEVQRLVAVALARHCRRVHCTPAQRDDLMQEGLLVGLQAAASHDSTKGSSMASWVLRRVSGQLRDSSEQLHNYGITHRPRGLYVYADALPTIRDADGEADDTDPVAELVDPSQSVESTACVADLLDTLDAELAPEQARILDMYYGEDLPTREIAVRLGVSHVAVADRIRRALQAARTVLAVEPTTDAARLQ